MLGQGGWGSVTPYQRAASKVLEAVGLACHLQATVASTLPKAPDGVFEWLYKHKQRCRVYGEESHEVHERMKFELSPGMSFPNPPPRQLGSCRLTRVRLAVGF